MRNGVPACVAIAAVLPALLSLFLTPARAAGVYEDAAGHAGFLTSPGVPSIRAAFFRADADAGDASVFVVSAAYPVRGYLMVQADLPYVSLAGPSDIDSDFGDAVLRARLRVAGGRGRSLHLLGGLRLGTGTRNLFPYASQSTDAALGVGYVDTLRVVHVWASASGVAVYRVPNVLEDLHENYAHFAAGITIPLHRTVAVRSGVTVLLFSSDAVRDITMAEVLFHPSAGLGLHLGAEVEGAMGGSEADRAVDIAVTAGVAARF